MNVDVYLNGNIFQNDRIQCYATYQETSQQIVDIQKAQNMAYKLDGDRA